MGTTRIKIVDLSSDQEQIKTSRKHAEKLASVTKLKAAGPEDALAQRAEKKTKVREGLKDKEGLEVKKEEATQTAEVQQSEPSVSSQPSQPSKPPTKKHHLSKKYQKAAKLIDKNRLYPPAEAIDLLRKTSYTKFDPTVEVHFNVADKNITGRVNLPFKFRSKTKDKKILVFSDQQSTVDDKLVIWGNDKTIDDIAAGRLKPNRDFDKIYATPRFMPKLAKIAKILGPANLMPNPKNGTVVENFETALFKKDDEAFEYKTDPNAPIIHSQLGKLSAKPQDLEQNLKALAVAIGSTKIKKTTITSTMSPPVKVDIAKLS